jgi:AAA+ superfamily predicted ATPase
MFSGYSSKMDQFLKYDPGIPSRVPHTIKFTDYSDEDLLRILLRLVKTRFRKRMQVEGGIDGLYSRILVRRLGRGRGKEGFGNARAVENAFSKVCERQADRLRQERRDGKEPDDFLLTKEDMIGPEPGDALIKSTAWQELQNLIGVEDVKESIKAFFHRVLVNYHRELQEKEPIQVGLNRVFLGPPGTGKTTVGKLYGQALADLGLLSSGDSVVKNPTDFIGEYIGSSEAATRSILTSAKGKVLIIDEAHMLFPGSRSGCSNRSDIFRVAVIDTLVGEIQNIPGEDRCVILMGYTEPMLEMFHHVNPGLTRRFPLEDAFHFKGFSIDQLAQILDQKVKKQDIEMTSLAKKVALEMLSLARDRPNFGNGGEVDNILSHAKAAQQKRISTCPPAESAQATILEPEDFDANYNRLLRRGKNCRELFEDVVGCEDVIAQFEGYQQIAEGMRMHGIDPRPHIPFTFMFKGPPGTGKTTTARKIGQIFYEMGFLSSAAVVECSVSDMVAEYTGQTGPKVITLLERALGKVLFVDEAYRLGQGEFARDAVNELVDCITKKRFVNKIVIILAGYEEDMNNLMRVNQGLASRFATQVVFRHLPPQHCLTLLQRRLGQLSIQISGLDGEFLNGSKKEMVVELLFTDLAATVSWGNGRDVETLAKTVMGHVFKSCALKGTMAGDLTVSFEELVPIMRQMLKEKRKRGSVGYRVLRSVPGG